MKQLSFAIKLLFVATIYVTATGCSNPFTTIDVTQSAKYHVGFIPGKIYTLKQDAALYTCGRNGKKTLAYVHPRDGGLFAFVPKDSLYLTKIGEFKRDPLSIAPKGSRVRIDKLQYYTFVTLSDVHRIVTASGTLLDAEDAGRTVLLTFLSNLVEVPDQFLDIQAQSPNPKMIAELTPTHN